jgi:transcriptional regulator with XRE-family HTH domain
MPRKPAPPTFGAALVRLREQRGWTSYKLAQRASLSLPAVLAIERGTDVKWSNALKLADALETSLDAFRPRRKE